jgi:hypothetical protein
MLIENIKMLMLHSLQIMKNTIQQVVDLFIVIVVCIVCACCEQLLVPLLLSHKYSITNYWFAVRFVHKPLDPK